MKIIPHFQFLNKKSTAKEIDVLRISSGLADRKIKKIYRPHKGSYYILMLITEGSGIHSINNRNFEIKKGDIIFLKEEEVHNFDKGGGV